MREIEFRAWNGESWIYSECISKDNDIWRILNHEDDEWWACLEPQQYTSLQDEKGKEIYEGDIVKFHYKKNIYKIGPVVWNDLFGSWDIDCTDFVAYKSLGQFKSVSEVIGNIYENPELLER